jgi:uncharacterized protein
MAMKTRRRLILAGGRGFLGTILAEYFGARGWEVTILTRQPQRPGHGIRAGGAVRELGWDGVTRGEWVRALEGADLLINLAGLSVNCRYHASNRRRLLASRLDSTRVLGEALTAGEQPPRVWMNSSTATIYQHHFGTPWDEDGEIGSNPAAKDAFSVEIATAWEREFAAAQTPQTRKLALRSAMVLGLGPNSVFPVLRRLVRFGLGGAQAGGQQFVSWIHETDFCRAIEWLHENQAIAGVVNLAAPTPLTNREMMSTLRNLCGMPLGLPATSWMLEAGAFLLRTETELVIKSRCVVSRRLREGGFVFRHTTMKAAMAELMTRSNGN